MIISIFWHKNSTLAAAWGSFCWSLSVTYCSIWQHPVQDNHSALKTRLFSTLPPVHPPPLQPCSNHTQLKVFIINIFSLFQVSHAALSTAEQSNSALHLFWRVKPSNRRSRTGRLTWHLKGCQLCKWGNHTQVTFIERFTTKPRETVLARVPVFLQCLNHV